jgi:Ca2+-binding RTX toxin-like protein
MQSSKQIPIFVLAGQSNVSFGGIDNRLYELVSSVGSNFDIVKVAVGGTSLFARDGMDWDPASGELYTQLIDAVKITEDKVKKAGFEPVVYTLWVQGEADTGNRNYGDQLKKFINQYRNDIGYPDSIFSISLLPYQNVVRESQISASALLSNVKTVDPQNARTWDGVHYDKSTRERIAEIYFSSLSSVIPTGNDYNHGLDRITVAKDAGLSRVTGSQFADVDYNERNSPVSISTFSGDDIVITGRFNDTIRTHDNNDIVRSGAGNDFIDLGTHDDIAYAGRGDDHVIGREGTDRIHGQDGNDNLRGMAQRDFIYGGNGNDRVDGGDGADLVKGDAGDDIVIGGAGRDILVGGAGSDTFLFTSADFAGGASASLDRITDFSPGDGDIIDLSGIDANTATGTQDDAFVYLGTEKFTKRAGELRLQVTSKGAFLFGDVNGDGKHDIAITLAHVTTLDPHMLVL